MREKHEEKGNCFVPIIMPLANGIRKENGTKELA
jgi:hypothetical protein